MERLDDATQKLSPHYPYPNLIHYVHFNHNDFPPFNDNFRVKNEDLMEGLLPSAHQYVKQRIAHPQHKSNQASPSLSSKQNHVSQVGAVVLYGVPIVSLIIENQERLCLAQISNTLLKDFSYNEIHNRRVALGITCVQCTPVQLEILRRAGAMPVSSRRCGMITRREAERLCKSFLGDNAPPRLPDDFAFSVHHECAWGCRGAFLPSRYNSSRAKCIKCCFCGLFFSPNKFIFHSHRTSPSATYVQPDAANFNSWRRHMKLSGSPPEDIVHAWEDVKAMFNGGTRKRMMTSAPKLKDSEIKERKSPLSSPPLKQIKLGSATNTNTGQPPLYPSQSPTPTAISISHRVPPFSDIPLPISMMDYVWEAGIKTPYPFSPYLPWFNSAKRSMLAHPLSNSSDVVQVPSPTTSKIYHQSAFRPVYPLLGRNDLQCGLKRFPLIEPKHIEEDVCDNSEDIVVCDDHTTPLKKELQEDSNDSISAGPLLKRNSDFFYETGRHNFLTRSNSPEFLTTPQQVGLFGGHPQQGEAEDYSTKKRSPEIVTFPDQITLSKTEEDETVDIETTDELDLDSDKKVTAESEISSKEIDERSSPKSKIWTIARYSHADSDKKPSERLSN